MDSLILGLRVLLSLAAVFGLMWLAYRRVRNGAPARAHSLSVVARQTVGPKASVVLLDTEGKRFMLGVTEHGISVLHTGEAPQPEPALAREPEPACDELDQLPVGEASEFPTRRSLRQAAAFESQLRSHAQRMSATGSPVAGSIRHPGTWRLAAGALRTGRRP
jgi:flagellar protein FliO/FliZ